MRVVFRTDSSLVIGSGHLMRCLTLADALKAKGAQCQFISRAHPGHLLELVCQRGFEVTVLPEEHPTLPANTKVTSAHSKEPVHAPWLGCDWQTDAEQTCDILSKLHSDWLLVDHYAIDQLWMAAVRPHCKKIMVIDDLADRLYQCDLLLDQNLGRKPHEYANLVPVHCKVLIGPKYALLRPEFAAIRAYSLKRRQKPVLKQVLITMGGVDQSNATSKVLQALKGCSLPQDCRICVVMGLQAPSLHQVRAIAQDMPWATEVLVNIGDMAMRMAESDLAIGAAGSTAWELCCLGLPTLLVVMANNQMLVGQALQQAEAALLIGVVRDIEVKLPSVIDVLAQHNLLQKMSAAASAITDGRGVDNLINAMWSLND